MSAKKIIFLLSLLCAHVYVMSQPSLGSIADGLPPPNSVSSQTPPVAVSNEPKLKFRSPGPITIAEMANMQEIAQRKEFLKKLGYTEDTPANAAPTATPKKTTKVKSVEMPKSEIVIRVVSIAGKPSNLTAEITLNGQIRTVSVGQKFKEVHIENIQPNCVLVNISGSSKCIQAGQSFSAPV